MFGCASGHGCGLIERGGLKAHFFVATVIYRRGNEGNRQFGMNPQGDIERLIEPSIAALGYQLVRVRLTGGEPQVLQIMAERADSDGLDCGMNVDHCAQISRTISAVLDVEDPIPGAYSLEVSSPGIDRPLTCLADYCRFSGFDAKVEMRSPIDGRKRFKGELQGVADAAIVIRVEDRQLTLPFNEVAQAKLILTDKLVSAVTRDAAGANAN